MKKYLKYLITSAIGIIISLLIIISKDLFKQTETATIFHILSDAFFVPGVLLAGFGILIVTVNGGSIDMIAYGIKSFLNFFKSKMDRSTESFYEYRTKREAKKREFWYLLIVGIVFIAIALIMYYFYNKFYI